MKLIKYSQIKDGQISASAIVGGGSGSSTTNIEQSRGGSYDLDRTIWGKEDTGNDIDGTMIVNGDINIKEINHNWEDDDEEFDGEVVEYEEGGGNLNVDLKTTTKDLEVTNDAYIKNHLYINYNKNHSHSDNKKCIGEILNGIETNIETNKTNIASNLSEINALKTRVSTNETNIANNTTAINSLDVNLQIAEQSIKNNADEIVTLKNRTTANETAISSLLPIGSIIMYNGLSSDIPEGWAIWNGENGTPNLIGKFVKAWTESGQTGGNNSITLSKEQIPTLGTNFDTTTFNAFKTTETFKRLNKKFPVLDSVEEYVFDEGGSTHYCVYTGKNRGDKGLISVDYNTLLSDVAQFTEVNKNNNQQSINIEPSYYSLIYL